MVIFFKNPVKMVQLFFIAKLNKPASKRKMV